MATPEDGRWVGRAAVVPTSRARYPRPTTSTVVRGVTTTRTPTSRQVGSSGRPPTAGPPPTRTGPPGGGGPPRRLRPRWGRIAFVGVVALALIVGLISVAALMWAHNLDERLKRTDPF